MGFKKYVISYIEEDINIIKKGGFKLSQPNYIRKNAYAPVSIVIRIEELTNYVFRITNNEKYFPKVMRYTLSAELRKCCIDMTKHVYAIISINPRYQKQYTKRIKYQEKLYDDLITFKALVAIAISNANVKNLKYLVELSNNVFDGYSRLTKNDRRKYSNLPTKKEYLKRKQKREEERRKTLEEYNNMPVDEDGFKILIRNTTSYQ